MSREAVRETRRSYPHTTPGHDLINLEKEEESLLNNSLIKVEIALSVFVVSVTICLIILCVCCTIRKRYVALKQRQRNLNMALIAVKDTPRYFPALGADHHRKADSTKSDFDRNPSRQPGVVGSSLNAKLDIVLDDHLSPFSCNPKKDRTDHFYKQSYGTVRPIDSQSYRTVYPIDNQSYEAVRPTNNQSYGTVHPADNQSYGKVQPTDSQSYGTGTAYDHTDNQACEEKSLVGLNSNPILNSEEEGTLLVSIDQPVEEPCPTVDLREDPDLHAMPEASTSALASPLGLYKPSQSEPPRESLVTLWQPSSAMDEVEQVLPEQNDGYEYDVESPHEYYQSLGTDSSENMHDSSLNLPTGAFVPESVYNYLDKQLWVKLVLSSGGKMEVMVKGISEAEARADILQNTALQEHQLTVATFVSSTFRYL